MRALLLSVLMCASTAFAEADKNSIAIFFGDGTYAHREVDSTADIARLRVEGKDYVTVHFYTVQSGGGLPVLNISGGNEQISLAFQSRGPGGGNLQPKGIIFHVANFTPPGARENRLGVDQDVGNDFFNRTFNGPATTAGNGMPVSFNTFDFSDPLYELLEDCIEGITGGGIINLQSQVVPAEGTYYDDNGTPENGADDNCFKNP